MKKFLLALSALVALSGTATAQDSPFRTKEGSPSPARHQRVKAEKRQADPQDGFLVFGYCNGLYTGIATGTAKQKLQAAIEIPEATARQWTGNKLTKVRIGFGESQQKDITLFLTSSLTGEAFYTQEATMKVAGGWNEVTLETPYDVTGDSFFIGYSIVTKTANDYPIGVDGIATNSTLGDWIAIENDWDHIGSMYGNMCIQAVIEGDNLPQNDLAVVDYFLPDMTAVGQPFDAALLVVNNGAKNVSSVGLQATVGGETQTITNYVLNPSVIAPGEMAEIDFSLVSNMESSAVPISITITEVNGSADENPGNNTLSVSVPCIEKGYQRNVVIEEWTGIWCGWCPRGFVAMEYMEETYGDENFIGIAVHGPNANQDPMYISSYSGFLTKFADVWGGYPGCVIDRNSYYMMDPNKEDLDYYYNQLVKVPAYGKVDLNVEYPEEGATELQVSADAVFAVSESNAKFRLAFAITENDLGPYGQTNYYAKTYNQGQKLEWWDEQGGNVYVKFNHVPRIIKNVLGINNSVPKDIVKGETYTYETTISTSAVKNIDNCEVVALLLDYSTSRIVNAAKVRMSDVAYVEGIDTESSVSISTMPGAVVVKGGYSDACVYAIDGSLVARAAGAETVAVAPGIYVVKVVGLRGETKTAKVMVR